MADQTTGAPRADDAARSLQGAVLANSDRPFTTSGSFEYGALRRSVLYLSYFAPTRLGYRADIRVTDWNRADETQSL